MAKQRGWMRTGGHCAHYAMGPKTACGLVVRLRARLRPKERRCLRCALQIYLGNAGPKVAL